TDLTPGEVAERRQKVESGSLHPMEAKRELARTIVSDFHSADAAAGADTEFRKVFSSREAPTEIPESLLAASAEPQPLVRVLTAAGLAPSATEAKRLIAQGGVSIDDVRADDPARTLPATAGTSYLLKVGKRKFLRVRFEGE
ncbi:MAG: tyrosine--tRNA ligase, partial [Acidobacteria bacterium]|nr:tyrosine--tRNA ligase [Acidobacteriota bacterium]